MTAYSVMGAGDRRLRCALWAVVAALAAPLAVDAQEPLGAPLREAAEEALLHMRGARAQLGVVLGPAEQVDGRTGVRVIETPADRPAARAGIRAGDILLALDGTPLGDQPGAHLVRLMRDVEPGDTVDVLLHRDGSQRTVRVVTEPQRGAELPPGLRIELLRPGMDQPPGSQGTLRWLWPAVRALGRHDLHLVDMNPGLGRYFGTDGGVLVANIAPDSGLGLQPGDVILSVGGRPVRDTPHARSILASYRDDEEVEIEIMRDRRRTTVRATPGSTR
jgi:S1-C subfamily serine protease